MQKQIPREEARRPEYDQTAFDYRFNNYQDTSYDGHHSHPFSSYTKRVEARSRPLPTYNLLRVNYDLLKHRAPQGDLQFFKYSQRNDNFMMNKSTNLDYPNYPKSFEMQSHIPKSPSVNIKKSAARSKKLWPDNKILAKHQNEARESNLPNAKTYKTFSVRYHGPEQEKLNKSQNCIKTTFSPKSQIQENKSSIHIAKDLLEHLHADPAKSIVLTSSNAFDQGMPQADAECQL